MDFIQKVLSFITAFFISTSVVATPASSINKVSIVLGGDVMLGRSVMAETLDKNDFNYPFLHIADYFKNADISFFNLENPIVENCPKHTTGFTFCADPRQVAGIKNSGTNVVSIANNHTLNYGKKGFEETKKFLAENQINYTGDNNLVIKEVNKTKFGFLAFDKSQQSNPKLSIAEGDLIKQSDSKVDVLIVSMHWGTEYQNKALPGVRNLAKNIIELGADAIVGHHPHWVQDWELIDGKPVYYSLGNLIFDQMWSEETKKGLIVKMYFENGRFVRDEKLPTYMSLVGQPQFVTE